MYRDIQMAASEVARRIQKAHHQLERAAVSAKEAEAGVAQARATLEGARQYLVDCTALAERAPDETGSLEQELQELRTQVVGTEQAMGAVEEEIREIFLGKHVG